jgi:hypothetical protein
MRVPHLNSHGVSPSEYLVRVHLSDKGVTVWARELVRGSWPRICCEVNMNWRNCLLMPGMFKAEEGPRMKGFFFSFFFFFFLVLVD